MQWPANTPDLGTPGRWGVLCLGLSALLCGIALSITADLGVGSWQVLETEAPRADGPRL